MNSKEFDTIVKQAAVDINDTLIKKAGEYATDADRLHNFRVAAALAGTNMREALGGMMIKHTVSVYDMIYAQHEFTDAQWAEKIGDHLNYLVLLKAVVAEEELEFPEAAVGGELSSVVHHNETSKPYPSREALEAARDRAVQNAVRTAANAAKQGL